MQSSRETTDDKLEDGPPRRAPEQRRSRERVAKILDSAASLIESEGLAAMTMSRLAEEAMVSLPSIYRYFPSKQAILRTLLARYTDEIRSAILLAPDGPLSKDDLSEMIDVTVDRYWEYVGQRPAYAAVWAAAYADPELLQTIISSIAETSRGYTALFEGKVNTTPDDELLMFMVAFLGVVVTRVATLMEPDDAAKMLEMMKTRVVPALIDIDHRPQDQLD